jgi:hypothetical protein
VWGATPSECAISFFCGGKGVFFVGQIIYTIYEKHFQKSLLGLSSLVVIQYYRIETRRALAVVEVNYISLSTVRDPALRLCEEC